MRLIKIRLWMKKRVFVELKPVEPVELPRKALAFQAFKGFAESLRINAAVK